MKKATHRVQRFFQKVFLLDILEGLLVTLRYYFSPKVTVPYPEKVEPRTARFRGILRLYLDEKGEPLCIACKACQRICPTNCFVVEGVRPEGSKTLRPTRYDWKLYRCSFCGLCTEVCPTAAIRFSREFRLSLLGKDHLTFQLADMYLEGEDLQKFLCGGCP